MDAAEGVSGVRETLRCSVSAATGGAPVVGRLPDIHVEIVRREDRPADVVGADEEYPTTLDHHNWFATGSLTLHRKPDTANDR